MKNNKTIISYIKENLHKDLNDSYNELGCAQTVNNILRNCLGYVAGGGPSTAKMLEVIVGNPNFKEVTRNEARAGDIILSATGTGNGKIDHGHVGFLGDNGVIYSNNSYKDRLDNHLTAEDWKSTFAQKGGFPVRYFRAIGKPTIEWKSESSVPKVLQSSQNPHNISLAIKSAVPLVIAILASQNITVSEDDIVAVITAGTTIVSAMGLIWGIVRKYQK